MDKDADLRVVRTEQLIRTAFFKLIETLGFEKITVQNLTQKAAINRSTFYLHYTDKYDLLNTLETELLTGIRKILDALDFNVILQSVRDNRPMPHIIQILEYVKENERFYTLIMSSKGDPSFILKVGDLIRLVMMEMITKHGIMNRLKIPVNYAFSMVIAIITSFLTEWLRTGLKETPYELAGIATMVIRDIPHNLIDLEAVQF